MVSPEEKTVLVVDDEEDIVVYLKTLLEDAGFNVVTASNGEEALKHVRNQTPDLISLDLVMPRKSGIRFFYELRKDKKLSKIPVVIVTGHAQDEKVKKEMDELFPGATILGPQTYLEKPVKPQDYIDIVNRQLGIEAAEGAKAASSSRAGLVKEARELLESADGATLEAALNLLRGNKERA